MSIHKDNATGKWRVVYRYIDWTGETHQCHPKEDFLQNEKRRCGNESYCCGGYAKSNS